MKACSRPIKFDDKSFDKKSQPQDNRRTRIFRYFIFDEKLLSNIYKHFYSYVWEEDYDTRQAPSRWVRRKMEQENSIKTLKARKERSQEIQALVDWVRRRDPRVKKYRAKLEEKQKINEEKSKRARDEKRMNDLIAAAKYESENKHIFDEHAGKNLEDIFLYVFFNVYLWLHKMRRRK
jgi:ATPase subunit of ABC transporter with duplicated ATPase domains